MNNNQYAPDVWSYSIPPNLYDVKVIVHEFAIKTKEYLMPRYHLVATMIRIGPIIQMIMELLSSLTLVESRDILMRMSLIH